MKHSTLVTLMCLFFFVSGFAQTTDSVYAEFKQNGVWLKSDLTIYTRDASCSLVSTLSKRWDESSQSWVNSFFSTYHEDNTGANSEWLGQSWDAVNNIWIDASKTFSFTENDGLKRTYLSKTWDALSNSWINSYRIIYDFDNEGRTVANEFDLYSNNEWQRIQRGMLSYDANGYVAQTIFQVWTNGAWANNSKTIYNYTGNGISWDYLWSIGTSTWIKFRRTFNDYLDGTAYITKSLGQTSTAPTWQNAFRSEQAYSNSNEMLSSFYQYWDENTQSWLNAFQIKEDYYANGNQNHFIYEGWDATTNSWAYGSRFTSTDVSCIQSLQFVPVTEIKNNAGVLMQSKNGNYLLHRMPSTKTNSIQSTLNMLAGNRNSVVYDFSFKGSGSQPKEYAFALIISSAAKPQSVKSKKADNAVTATGNSFTISPNPARDYFNINIRNTKNTGDVMLKLTDVSGKLIMQKKMQGSGMQKVNLPSLQKGMYIVTITSGKEIQNQKLVIQ